MDELINQLFEDLSNLAKNNTVTNLLYEEGTADTAIKILDNLKEQSLPEICKKNFTATFIRGDVKWGYISCSRALKFHIMKRLHDIYKINNFKIIEQHLGKIIEISIIEKSDD